MKEVNILFPNQLFQESPLFDNKAPFYLVEEFLFFKQYPFHKQKIAFHRATMKRYADFLKNEKNLTFNRRNPFAFKNVRIVNLGHFEVPKE